jgi:hypothetical protein
MLIEDRDREKREATEYTKRHREIMKWHPFKNCYNHTQLYAWKLKLLNGESIDLSGLKCFTGDWR